MQVETSKVNHTQKKRRTRSVTDHMGHDWQTAVRCFVFLRGPRASCYLHKSLSSTVSVNPALRYPPTFRGSICLLPLNPQNKSNVNSDWFPESSPAHCYRKPAYKLSYELHKWAVWQRIGCTRFDQKVRAVLQFPPLQICPIKQLFLCVVCTHVSDNGLKLYPYLMRS